LAVTAKATVKQAVVARAMPLGLDFHTLRDKRTDGGKLWWGERKMASLEQYRVLCSLRQSAAVSVRARPVQDKVLAPFRIAEEPIREGFFHSHGIPTRRAVFKALNESGLVELVFGKRRRDMWAEMARHAFVVSPVGHGLDAHRTWEAVSLGCIVLVESSPLDSLYTDNELPVAIMPDLAAWEALNSSKLAELLEKFAPWTEPEHLVPRLDTDFWFKPPDPHALRH